MQLDLIAEEYKEFCAETGIGKYEDELKELADLVYVCYLKGPNYEPPTLTDLV
jgi:hypothetical protein